MNCQNEPKERLDTIVTTNYERVYRIAYSRVHNVEDAKDLTQETFLMLTKQYDTYSYSITADDKQMDSLLTCMVLRRAANFNRDSTRKLNHMDLYDNEPSEPSVEEKVFDNIDTELIKESILELPAQYSSYLYMVMEQDMTPEEIASALDVKPDSLRSIASRARRKLKEICEKKGVKIDIPKKRKK